MKNSTTLHRHAAQFGVFDSTGQWEKARQSVHGSLLASERIASLARLLPADWHLEKYGNDGAVACFPPGGPCEKAFTELSAFAPISSVCGPFYVITHFVHNPSLT